MGLDIGIGAATVQWPVCLFFTKECCLVPCAITAHSAARYHCRINLEWARVTRLLARLLTIDVDILLLRHCAGFVASWEPVKSSNS